MSKRTWIWPFWIWKWPKIFPKIFSSDRQRNVVVWYLESSILIDYLIPNCLSNVKKAQKWAFWALKWPFSIWKWPWIFSKIFSSDRQQKVVLWYLESSTLALVLYGYQTIPSLCITTFLPHYRLWDILRFIAPRRPSTFFIILFLKTLHIFSLNMINCGKNMVI